jgi:hypothetical protein
VIGELELALELGRKALERFDIHGEALERALAEARKAATA